LQLFIKFNASNIELVYPAAHIDRYKVKLTGFGLEIFSEPAIWSEIMKDIQPNGSLNFLSEFPNSLNP